MTKTKIWRNFNEVKNAGMFVWEVGECDGVTKEESVKYPGLYLETLDGGYILAPSCIHFWSEVKAYDYFFAQFDRYFEVIPIGDGPVLF